MEETQKTVLWAPSPASVNQTHMSRFANSFLSALGQPPTHDYSTLHSLSLAHADLFWRHVWNYCGVPGDHGDLAFIPGTRMIDARWFPHGRAKSLAILAYDEAGKEIRMTRRELFEQVAAVAGFLKRHGIQAGDRVAAVLPNVPEAVVAMLATAAIGAVWSSCSPEFGDDAVVDRFGQINPRVLITAERTTYNHKLVEPAKKVDQILPRLPSVKLVVTVGSASTSNSQIDCIPWQEALAEPPLSDWDPFPFAHPLCIVYSSGTTGAPKCIVHGTGGTVLQHVKEHRLHCNLNDGDCLFYYTTTGWMMWNWLLSGLASNATIVLYDGSPFANGPQTLLDIAEKSGVTHFGAGARYYAALEKHDVNPKNFLSTNKLRCLLSTGSPLLPSNFDWLYSAFGDQFTLGMDVQIWNEDGRRVLNTPGELVCVSPFPCMPIGFWNDPTNEKYLKAYFSRFENVWCHGDWAEENEQGELVIYGRSDATLNPGGVRIGTAEIYQQLEAFPEIIESLATVLRQDGDEQIVLFLRVTQTDINRQEIADRIRARLKTRCSPRHVPRYIAYAPDLPRTVSGKLSEIAVRSAICGEVLGNAGALANPDSLRFFESWKPTDAH
ncbi:MAG: AMP-binding protein [Pirellula sp.]|nr:AMP-binding protein [Pirellula sp.]